VRARPGEKAFLEGRLTVCKVLMQMGQNAPLHKIIEMLLAETGFSGCGKAPEGGGVVETHLGVSERTARNMVADPELFEDTPSMVGAYMRSEARLGKAHRIRWRSLDSKGRSSIC